MYTQHRFDSICNESVLPEHKTLKTISCQLKSTKTYFNKKTAADTPAKNDQNNNMNVKVLQQINEKLT